MKAPIPINERERLAALSSYELLDSDAEQCFDDITLLASNVCGTPIALISLVDKDRQWFKSKLGLVETETPRDTAFCAHGILQSDVFEVPDACADERFLDSELVTGQSKIRFYAGSPLVTPQGHALGMLCVLDHVPRTISATQKTALCALSRQVVAQLELRKSLKESQLHLAERKASEERLQLQQTELRVLVDLIPAMVWFKDTSNRILRVNKRAADAVGLPVSAIEGKSSFDIYPQEAVRFYLDDREVIRSGRPKLGIVETIRDRDGKEHWLRTDKVPFHDADGKVAGIAVMAQDFTEHRQTEAAAAHLAAIVQHSDAAIISMDLRGRITSWNAAAETVFGYSASEIIGQPITRLIPPDRPQEENEILNLLQKGETVNHFDTVRLRKDGQAIHVSLTSSPIKDSKGEIIGASKVLRDISDRKRVEEQLLLLSSATEQSKESIVITDAELDLPGPRIVFVNPAFTKMTGYTPEDVLGKTPRILQGPRTDRSVLDNLRQNLRAGEVFEGEAINYRKDGSAFTNEWHIAPLRDTQGKITHFVALQRDITERKRISDELLQAKKTAEQANRAKSEFLAMMSHEIRTPMNGLIGFTNLLLETPLSETQRHFANTIQLSGKNLLKLINDILDFSKIEAGKLTIEAVSFDLEKVVAEVVELFAEQVKQKNLCVRIVYSPVLPPRIIGDPGRVRQVLLNLVGNAMKFTRQGEICVRLQPNPSDSRFVRCEIADSGPGIPADKQAKLFQLFSQADSSTTRRHGGTGLGLAISKRLVELMGGTIGLTSEPDKGSSFWFTLPARTEALAPATNPDLGLPLSPTSTPSANPRWRTSARLRVLLAEDDPTSQKLVVHLLAQLSCDVEVAANGREAVDLATQRKHDLIFLDCLMPQLDGLEATRLIRRAQSGTPRVPIIAITASVSENQRRLCQAAGMDDFIAKPIQGQELKLALEKWCPQLREAQPATFA